MEKCSLDNVDKCVIECGMEKISSALLCCCQCADESSMSHRMALASLLCCTDQNLSKYQVLHLFRVLGFKIIRLILQLFLRCCVLLVSLCADSYFLICSKELASVKKRKQKQKENTLKV